MLMLHASLSCKPAAGTWADIPERTRMPRTAPLTGVELRALLDLFQPADLPHLDESGRA
ncbi:hypothetical protein GCM10009610_56440 [Pseudonocardia xinjiangensis]